MSLSSKAAPVGGAVLALLVGLLLSYIVQEPESADINAQIERLSNLSSRVENTKICLSMVSNSSLDVFVPSFLAAVPHVVAGVVCTDSTDNEHKDTSTPPAVIKQLFKAVNFSGTVEAIPWGDESHNRAACMVAAQESMKRSKTVCDYWMSLTDSQVVVDDGSSLVELKLDQEAYWIREVSHNQEISRVNCIRADLEWTYSDAFQEFIPVGKQSSIPIGNLPAAFFTRRASEGSQRRPVTRDVALLEKLARDLPDDPKTAFYLANALAASNRPQEAIQHWARRVSMPQGWNEEAYISAMYIGEEMEKMFAAGGGLKNTATLKALEASGIHLSASISAGLESPESDDGDGGVYIKIAEEDVLAAYNKASSILEYRPEALFKAAKFSRRRMGDHQACFEYAQQAASKGPSFATTLFTNGKVTEILAPYEVCICGMELQGKARAIGKAMCTSLLEKMNNNIEESTNWELQLLDSIEEILESQEGVLE